MADLERGVSSPESLRQNQIDFLVESYVYNPRDKETKETFMSLVKNLSDLEFRQTQVRLDQLFQSESSSIKRRSILELKAGMINILQERLSNSVPPNVQSDIPRVSTRIQEVIEEPTAHFSIIEATCSLKQIKITGKVFKNPKIKTEEIEDVPMLDVTNQGVDENGFTSFLITFDGKRVPVGAKLTGNIFSVVYQGQMYSVSLGQSREWNHEREYDQKKESYHDDQKESQRTHFEVRNGRGMRVTKITGNVKVETIEYIKNIEFQDRDIRVKFEVLPR